MLCNRDKRKLQRCLEDLYCNQCDVCICGCGCCKDVATNVCDCCVDPMENLLKELKQNEDPLSNLTIITNTGSNFETTVGDITVKDGIVTFDSNVIAICSISSVLWDQINVIPDTIRLLPPVCTCGECDCCERPLREELSKLATDSIILVDALGGINAESLIFKKVGLGIFVGEDSTSGRGRAFSICKTGAFDQVV